MKSIYISFVLWIIAFTAVAKEIPQKGKHYVYDFADLLNQQEEKALELKIKNYYDTTSTAIAIVIEESLEGEAVEDVAYNIASTWKIGSGKKDNGILIYIAAKEHKIDIETGRGMEGVVGNLDSKRIIQEIMRPAFKANKYYEGLDGALNRIFGLSEGQFQAEPKGSGSKIMKVILLIIGFIILILYIKFGGKNRRRNVLGRTFSSGGWYGGWGGGFGGGGGGGSGGGDGGSFGGFDGGSFGGSGASGDW